MNLQPGEKLGNLGGTMYEKRTMTETRTFVIKVYCDCNGQFEFNGNANLSNPPQYVHACSDCGQIAYFSDQYPMNHTQEVGEPMEMPDA